MLTLALAYLPIGNPYNDPNIKGDPYRTLFVSNLVSTNPSDHHLYSLIQPMSAPFVSPLRHSAASEMLR
jgi:hypothetical protein